MHKKGRKMLLKRKLRIIRENVTKNHLSFPINLYHLTYDRLNIAKNRAIAKSANTDCKNIALNIKKYGHAIVPSIAPEELIAKIKSKADYFYDNGINVDYKGKDAGLTRIQNCLINIPEIAELVNLESVSGTLQSLYGGHFQLFHADIYRTEPKNDPEAFFGSQKWHYDNVTWNMVKLMVYLKDISVENGAMRIVPKPESARIRNSGFVKRSQTEFTPEIEKHSISLEAKSGTGVFFKPQECIHQAAEPKSGCRDVIVFMFYPSLSKQAPLTDKDKEQLSQPRSHLCNPFTGRLV
jgi:hypothetical protein